MKEKNKSIEKERKQGNDFKKKEKMDKEIKEGNKMRLINERKQSE